MTKKRAGAPAAPQWLQADLSAVRRVQSLAISWENPVNYQFRVEGRKDLKDAWVTLVDASAAPGASDGPLATKPADVRYVRVTVVAAGDGHWASIRELKIGVLQDGKTVNWQTPAPVAMPPAIRDAFAAPGFSDAKWDTVSVPSNWEMAGYSIPTYDSVDNSVGLYRRTIAVPASWGGQRVYLPQGHVIVMPRSKRALVARSCVTCAFRLLTCADKFATLLSRLAAAATPPRTSSRKFAIF